MAYQQVILIDGVPYPASVINDISAALAGLTTAYRPTPKVLASAASTVTFSSIPSTLRNLRLVCTARGDTAATAIGMFLRVDSNSGANYHYNISSVTNTTLTHGANASQAAIQVASIPAASATSGVWGSSVIDIPGWGAGHPRLNVQARGHFFDSAANSIRVSSGGSFNVAGPWTSLTLFASAGNLITGSEFTLTGD